LDTDTLHEFGNHPDWNESFYFNFYDRKADIFAFMRMGLKPNRNEKASFCFFIMPDGSLIGTTGHEPVSTTELKVRDLRFERITPEKKWHLTFSGTMDKHTGKTNVQEQVSFELDWESLNQVFDYRECVTGMKEKISEEIATQHFEQFGKATGRLAIGGKDHAIIGLGERDHSWGVRDWNAPKMWIWLTCQFSEKSALNATKLVMDAGEVDAGFIHIKGRNVPLIEVNIETKWDPSGNPRGLEMTIDDKEGKTHNVMAEVMRPAVLPFPGRDGKNLSLLHENLARYTMKSEVGYGVSEYLIRTR